MIITSLLTKFHQNPTSRFWEILLTNKQTDRRTKVIAISRFSRDKKRRKSFSLRVFFVKIKCENQMWKQGVKPRGEKVSQTHSPRRKKYWELEAKVKNAIERHQDENTIAFLRAIASLSMSNWTLWINYYKNFACIVPEFSKNSLFSKTTRLFPAKI